MSQVFAVIAAAGSGTRMKMKTNKQLLPLAGKPILLRTMEAFDKHEQIYGYVVVASQSNVPLIKKMVTEKPQDKLLAVVTGGQTRQESVKSGLDFLCKYHGSSDDSLVLIHDGARCLVSRQVISRVIEGISLHGASGAAMRVKDTIKVADSEGKVVETPDRNRLWAMQTPQGANLSLLATAYTKAEKNNWQATDDLALLEMSGNDIYLVDGDEMNIKITTPIDLELAEALLSGH